MATVLHLLPPARVNLATGAFFSSLNLGLTVAMLMTPIVAKLLGWRVPLSIFAILAIILLAIISLFTHADLFRGSWNAISHTARTPDRQGSGWALALVSAANFCLFFQSFAMITWLPEYLVAAARISTPAGGGDFHVAGVGRHSWVDSRRLACGSRGAWAVAVVGRYVVCDLSRAVILLPDLRLPGVAGDICVVAFGTSLLTIPLTSVLAKLVAQEHGGKAVGLILTTGYSGGSFPRIWEDIF